jgi:hypothetical protein
MKKIIITIIAAFSISAIQAQNFPIDFEAGGNGASWTWTVFENDDNPPLVIAENPSKTGINTSDSVAQFTSRSAGQAHAGCESLHGGGTGEFKIDSSNSTITIMVYKPVVSDVGIKLVTATGWSKGELKVANTKTNEWEELSFDFSTVDHENMTYDQIVVFPDFASRTADVVSYFDNITVGGSTVSVNEAIDMSKLKVYPIPAKSSLNVKLEGNSEPISSVSMYNSVGNEVYTSDVSLTTETAIDVSAFTAGMYFVKVQTAQGLLTRKVIIE